MNVNERIAEQLSTSQVLLYMKGSPDFPQCGFSGQAAQILNACHCKYDYINILEDDELRQGLKDYSEWPTFPQLYINAEFIGGADIMLQLYHDGSLLRLLTEVGAVAGAGQ